MVSECVMRMDIDSDSDISWLTQTLSIEKVEASFDVGYEYIKESLDLSVVDNSVVSLEEYPGTSKEQVLYDNVIVEDISSDENKDTL